MTVLRRYQAGDTSRFSIQIAFHVDPDGGHGATADESLSWGGFQIWVDGHNLCAHHVDVDAILERLDVAQKGLTLEDRSLRGAATDGEQHEPTIFINDAYPSHEHREARRFTLAQELCHLLVDTAKGRTLAMASGPWAPVDVERRANAFAAMLVMPMPLLTRAIAAIDAPLHSTEGVSQVARKLETSHTATLNHLFNMGYLDEAHRAQLTEGL